MLSEVEIVGIAVAKVIAITRALRPMVRALEQLDEACTAHIDDDHPLDIRVWGIVERAEHAAVLGSEIAGYMEKDLRLVLSKISYGDMLLEYAEHRLRKFKMMADDVRPRFFILLTLLDRAQFTMVPLLQ